MELYPAIGPFLLALCMLVTAVYNHTTAARDGRREQWWAQFHVAVEQLVSGRPELRDAGRVMLESLLLDAAPGSHEHRAITRTLAHVGAVPVRPALVRVPGAHGHTGEADATLSYLRLLLCLLPPGSRTDRLDARMTRVLDLVASDDDAPAEQIAARLDVTADAFAVLVNRLAHEVADLVESPRRSR